MLKRIQKILTDRKTRFAFLTRLGLYNGLSDEKYLKRKFKLYLGYSLNLDNPKTFNEKIQWLKIYDRKPEYTMLVDKYTVKKYIAKKIGRQYIIPTLGVWDRFDDIDFEALPDQFVLKCTHDSGSVIICHDKSKFNKKSARRMLNRCMKRNYYWIGREWPYKDVKPRIIAEKLIGDKKESVPEDYKVYCFGGKPEYIVVFHNRFNSNAQLSETVYDISWQPQHISLDEHFAISDIVQPRPECLDELLSICTVLCSGYPQLRVDFYIIENKIFFGEITFSTASGFQSMIPQKLDRILGNKINLFEIRNRQ